MAEPLGDWTRTHTCGALRADDVGAEAVLLGWVHRIRDLGGVTFIDIRDREGVTQVVVRENEALMGAAKRLRSEHVVGVKGVVQRRSDETVNTKLATGEVELLVRELRTLNEARTPPFQIAEDSPVSEEVRLKYRYLDLRRPRLQYNIGLRHRVTMAVRRFFDANGSGRRRIGVCSESGWVRSTTSTSPVASAATRSWTASVMCGVSFRVRHPGR